MAEGGEEKGEEIFSHCTDRVMVSSQFMPYKFFAMPTEAAMSKEK